MKPNTQVTIAGVPFKNPVMTASGTFNSGREYAEFFDLNQLGGIIVKGVSHEPWPGNAPPRIAETHGGMLNAIGLQNPGAAAFITDGMPFLRGLDTRVVVNLCGHTIDEYAAVAQDFAGVDGVDLFELNISCPNISKGGIAFGTDPALAAAVVQAVKRTTNTPVMVKLSPNCTDIVGIAKAVEAAGADAISLINTLLGMRIDIRRRAPVLANRYGGLSGPAIKPVALRLVHLVANAVDVPVVGMGGITTAEDAIEFIMAGATAVAVGTAHFTHPTASADVASGITTFLAAEGISDINQLRGVVQ